MFLHLSVTLLLPMHQLMKIKLIKFRAVRTGRIHLSPTANEILVGGASGIKVMFRSQESQFLSILDGADTAYACGLNWFVISS